MSARIKPYHAQDGVLVGYSFECPGTQAHADHEARMITGDEMARRAVAELASRGRLTGDERALEQDRRVVSEVLRGCLLEAFRTSISPGPIAATLDEIDRLGEPFDDEEEVTAS